MEVTNSGSGFQAYSVPSITTLPIIYGIAYFLLIDITKIDRKAFNLP